MKLKPILFILLAVLLCVPALALVEYTGQPSPPYMILGEVKNNGVEIIGAVVTVENRNTGYSITTRTNENGKYLFNGMSFLTTDAGRPPVMYGDNIVVTVTQGCGANDVCSKSFMAYTGSSASMYKDYAIANFAVTGTSPCPPCNCAVCPSCPSSSCNCPDCDCGSDSGYISYCSESSCRSKYPCPEVAEKECEQVICPSDTTPYGSCNSCCADKECEECVEKDCPECPDTSFLFSILLSLAGIVLGGFGWYSGYKGLINYYVNKGKEAEKAGDKKTAQEYYNRAAKMINTAVLKAKEGQYK